MYYSSITDIVCFLFTSCFPCFGDGVLSFDVVVVIIFVSLAESMEGVEWTYTDENTSERRDSCTYRKGWMDGFVVDGCEGW